MKIHSFKVEIILFFLILIFFIVPPITYVFFNTVNTIEFNNSLISPFLLVQFLLTLFLYIFYKEKNKDPLSISKLFFRIILPSTFTLSFLFFISLIFKYISIKTEGNISNIDIFKPDTFVLWILCIINFFISAFYEEIIYRFYLSDFILNFLKTKKIYIKIIIEAFVLILFALAHLYSGWLSVLNAAIAHIILRLCYKFTGSIFPGVLAHFVYNIISLILL